MTTTTNTNPAEEVVHEEKGHTEEAIAQQERAEKERMKAHRALALGRLSKLHERIDVLQQRLDRVRSKASSRNTRVAACLWQARAVLARNAKTTTATAVEGSKTTSPGEKTAAHPAVNMKRALSEAKKLSREAGIVEDEAERRLWDCDDVISDGDGLIRRHRKALVLRIKTLMKRAGKLAKDNRIVNSLTTIREQFPKDADRDSSSDESEEAPQNEASMDAEQDESALMDETDDVEADTTHTHVEESDEESDAESEEEMEEQQQEQRTSPRKRKPWSPTFTKGHGRNGSIVLTAQLPGVTERDLSVTIDDKRGQLNIKAISATHGVFEREFSVGDGLDIHETRAGLENGVLTITLYPPQQRYRQPMYNQRQQPQYRKSPFAGFGGFGSSGRGGWGFPAAAW